MAARLGKRGYTASSVRNQIARMVHRGALLANREGRFAVYRLPRHLETNLEIAASTHDVGEYDGTLSLLLHEIPERHRGARDRLLYLAHHHGYGRLRSGALLGIRDRSAEILSSIHQPGDCWVAVVQLKPTSVAHARELVYRAHDVAQMQCTIKGVEAKIATMEREFEHTGAVLRNRYVDLYYLAGMLAFRIPALPVELAEGRSPGDALRGLMQRLRLLYAKALAAEDAEWAREVAGAELIEPRAEPGWVG
ncbi:hypothetical protein [uncultured Tessaracoccus sp.]|uniref:hypothetical protein n=1 Tax=uncultured Tessaracoccus sp. TaxID=905023 RepID=UPI0025DA3E2C|nr:hypothetical protein [uncultured Tessaracoccus sp.]